MNWPEFAPQRKLVEPDWCEIAIPSRFTRMLREKYPGRPMQEVIIEALQSRGEIKRKSGVYNLPNDTISVVTVRLPTELKELVESKHGPSIVIDAIESYIQRPAEPKKTLASYLW